MLRRVLLATALVVGTVSAGWAADNATFVLTNGQRQSGGLIYGRGDNNIVDLKFHVSVSGNDVAIPIDQVAAIDFSGGAPSSAELNALPTSGGVMVMRDGSKINGHLHNIISGDQVQWVNESGQRQNYPISSVSRLYLKPAEARTAYNASGASGQAIGTTGGQLGNPIQVPGNQEWTDTGISVRRGERLAFQATGDVNVKEGASAGPAGTRAVTSSKYPVKGAPAGALIGRIGNGTPFYIGSNTQPLTMPASGQLMLGINDDYLGDNSGAFTVTVTRQ